MAVERRARGFIELRHTLSCWGWSLGRRISPSNHPKSHSPAPHCIAPLAQDQNITLAPRPASPPVLEPGLQSITNALHCPSMPPHSLHGAHRTKWRPTTLLHRHTSILLMLLAQLCSAILATIGRVLRTGHGDDSNEGMGTSEILLAMSLTTTLLSWPTARLHSVPSLPLGPPSARPLLALRSIAGAIAIWTFYYTLRTLPLSTASILNFLAPTLASLVLSLFPPSPHANSGGISPPQIAAALASLTGATCVLQPWNPSPSPSPTSTTTGTTSTTTTSSSQLALALLAALLSIVASATSYITLAHLSRTVHPSLTLAHFSTATLTLSALLLLLAHREPLHLPPTPLQWVLVLVLGVLGFGMHWLMTASLAREGDAKRPLNFVYTQIVWVVVADKVVWGVQPDAWKYLGGALIVGSAVFVASTREGHQYALVDGDGDGGEEEDELELEMGKERAEVAKDVEP
ncbi:hypothetical protein P171DRAFT_469291 [Karstenula rhodostoma CBS 690.94]|uniref:EamA domain-containing protein n=1 Tax=Karstenula rhodostoma CBS 690.94 TaxID=1392251 RepID=A0A9P4UGF8_9PLEO|nr:hypothetical protein P171DRAFT_469291 [Karstenula rhodostoma CBS 690.94]